MINFKKFSSVISLTSYFTSDDKCKQAIIESRWGVGKEQDIVCPYCGKHHCKMSKNGRFHCTVCNKNFSCLVGCYHDVSDEHLRQYIDKAVYRWNTRKMSESERFAHMFEKSIGLVRKWSEIKVGLMAA